MQLVVHNNSNEYKPATVPMSLKSVPAAGGDAVSTSANNKQQQVVNETVTSPQPATVIEQVDQVEPQPMETEVQVSEVNNTVSVTGKDYREFALRIDWNLESVSFISSKICLSCLFCFLS